MQQRSDIVRFLGPHPQQPNASNTRFDRQKTSFGELPKQNSHTIFARFTLNPESAAGHPAATSDDAAASAALHA